MARRSPCRTSRLTPLSTGTSSLPMVKVLRSSRQEMTASIPDPRSSILSFISQRLRRLRLRRTVTRIQRRQQADQEGQGRDQRDLVIAQIGRQFADVIHVLGEELHAEQVFDE